MKRLQDKIRRMILFAILIALLLAPAHAKGKGFKDVVKHIETNYRAKKTRIPMLGLANFAVKLIRPAGVKGFKLAVFEDQNFAARPEIASSFGSVMRARRTTKTGCLSFSSTRGKAAIAASTSTLNIRARMWSSRSPVSRNAKPSWCRSGLTPMPPRAFWKTPRSWASRSAARSAATAAMSRWERRGADPHLLHRAHRAALPRGGA